MHFHCIDFSPNGRLIASSIAQHTNSHPLEIWNCRDGSRKVLYESKLLYDIHFSPDGKFIAAADSGVLLWNVRTGQMVKKLEGHCCLVLSVMGSFCGPLVQWPLGDLSLL